MCVHCNHHLKVEAIDGVYRSEMWRQLMFATGDVFKVGYINCHWLQPVDGSMTNDLNRALALKVCVRKCIRIKFYRRKSKR